MEFIRAIFNFCSEILRFPIYLLGYRISLFEVVIFIFLGLLLIRFVHFFWDF